MKLIALIILLVAPLLSNGQIPNYFANNPSWHCTEAPSEGGRSYNYYINGNDTTIDNFTYHQFWIKGNDENGSDFNSLSSFLRQEGRSIHYYNSFYDTDTILVNYELEIGDSLKHAYYAVYGHWDTLTLQKIDSVLVGIEYRRQYYFDTINSGLLLTEGIGFQMQENNFAGGFIKSISIDIGTSYSIHCYGQNEIPLWHPNNTPISFCDLNITVGLSEISKSEVTLFPNPSSNQIQISSSDKIKNITILAIDGKISLETKNSNVDISALNPGLYIVNVRFENGETFQKTLIVDN